MLSAVVPANEQERVEALQDLSILDTGREQAYDDMTLLAGQICGTPMSAVTFVDPGRQWFKAKVGFLADSTDREVSFCAHTILGTDIFEVRDTLRDPRFADNPLVTGEPLIRFYAGVPLRTLSGHAVGALCVIDHRPRRLNDDQRTALAALARAVSHFLELRQATRRLQESLHDFKTLSGLIPICMHCKNIRSDAGYWKSVERYVENNSTARFSHCICPTCLEQFYGDLRLDA